MRVSGCIGLGFHVTESARKKARQLDEAGDSRSQTHEHMLPGQRSLTETRRDKWPLSILANHSLILNGRGDWI